METILVGDLLKLLIGGGGGGAVVLAVVFVWLHIRVKSNKRDINGIRPNCKEHSELIQKQEVAMATVSSKQDAMIKVQGDISNKIDTLIKFHLKG